jgi:peptide deformylase
MRILKYPRDTKLLRKPGLDVLWDDLSTEEFKLKLEQMKKLLTLDGVGLAATQVGWSTKLFILSVDKDMKPIEPIVYLNPEIVSRSKKMVRDEEGCLSFSGLGLRIARPKQISWKYTDLEGQEIEVESRGYYARAIMHEIDHLNGRLFIERASSTQLLKFKRWLRNE